MRMVYSVRTAEDVIYADELGDETALTFTREAARWLGRPHRPDRRLDAGRRGRHGVRVRVERVRRGRQPLLLETGYEPEQVRTERFGPTG